MKGHTPIDATYVAAAGRGDEAQAALLERALEALHTPPRRGDIETSGAAAWYANRGMRVFPLQPGSKQPLSGSHGVKDATTDVGAVHRSWWDGHNLGIATGGPFDVIDIDGPDGVAAFVGVLGDGAWLQVRGVTQTPRGWHIWVPATGRNIGSQTTHLDYRGAGGYVVAPPSQVGGTVYRWLLPPVLEN